MSFIEENLIQIVGENSALLFEELTKLSEKFPQVKIELLYKSSIVGYQMWHGSNRHSFELNLEDMEGRELDALWKEIRKLNI